MENMYDYIYGVWTNLKDDAEVALTETERDELKEFFRMNKMVIQFDYETGKIEYTIEENTEPLEFNSDIEDLVEKIG